ncbi:MAG: AraC family transcriptional regulator, partial [Alphaproteobacteria bacterium]
MTRRRANNPVDQARTVFAIFLVPEFSLFGFSALIDPLRAANRISGEPLYGWRLISRDGAPVPASSGIEVVVDADMANAGALSHLIVVAGMNAHRYADKDVLAWLRRLDRRGCRIGAISTASLLLARAGLLDGYRCTIHWENLASLREEYPDLDLTPEVFEIDRKRFTCSGGTAALDMMLALIALE